MRYICTSIVATLVLAGTTLAATINVPGDYPTIQGAVDAASDGDEILVAPGTYTSAAPYEVVDMRNKAVWMHSSGGPDVTIIDGEQTRRGIHCSDDVEGMTIEGFTIENCYGHTSGGGMYLDNNAQPTLKNCTFTNNTANNNGGAIYCTGSSSPTITGCSIANNTAHDGGGIFCGSWSQPAISNCVIESNTANNNGGGIHYSTNDNTTITDCEISGNTADHGGGIYFATGGTTTITDCEISGNTANTNGGGIFCGNSSSTISGCTFTSNMPDAIVGDFTMGEPASPTGACCVSSGCVATTNDDCTALGGTWLGEGGSCDDCPASCMGDTDGNGVVNIEDLLNMLGSWGACP